MSDQEFDASSNAPEEDIPGDDATRRHDPVIDEWSDATSEPPTVQTVSSEPEADLSPAISTGRALSLSRPLLIGCAAVGALAVIGAIVGAIMMLGGGGGWQALSLDNPIATHQDGISVALVGEGSLRLRLNSVPREMFLNGEAGSAYEVAINALPSYLEMKSPYYLLESKGEGGSTTEIVIPNDSQPYETLDLYRWDEELGQWVFVPSHIDYEAEVIRTDERPGNVAVFQVKQVTPLISTVLLDSTNLTNENASTLNMVLPTGISVREDGALDGALIGGWQLGAGYAVIPLISAEDGAALSALLNNEASRALHVEDLKAFVVGDGYNGIALGYRNVSPNDRAVFATFVQELATALDEYNKVLVVVVPIPEQTADGWETGGYDWRAIGAASDVVMVYPALDPNLYVDNGQIEDILRWGVGEVSRLKLHPAFYAISVDRTEGEFSRISYDAALESFGGVVAETNPPEGSDLYEPGSAIEFDLNGDFADFALDNTTGFYHFVEPRDGNPRDLWIMTAEATRRRMDLMQTYRTGGIAIFDLLNPGTDANTVNAVNEFRASVASSVPNQLLLKWTVNGASGAVHSQSTGIGTPLVWQADADGEYIVQANVVGGRVSDRGAVTVRIGAPATPTPSPTPTRAPNRPQGTAAPRNNNTPAPTQPPAAQPPASVGGAGHPGGGFELGGQVPGSLGPSPYMQNAGMTWVKFQAKWPYVDAATAGSFVSAGHAAGYKVLLSIPGPLYPTSIDFGAYSAHLGAVAAYQPDAIEIWNEMNLDREWPAGQLDPASYVNNMLAPGFNAIKAASPGTIVIIGALAPTGFDNGTNAWSDQRYLQGLAAAGAARYANCVGAHHNSGTTSPSVRSGRSEGDHYSWYFLPTIEVTYNAMGGSLPVCLTEFGYLTPDGYGPLPSTFSWGGGNTVQEQAQWLKEGADIARGLGWVRLMIVWNVGFTQYDSDPQAGYSIIRPDGSCPACDLLP